MAISVGSVTVDIIPSTQNIYQRLKDGLVPAATKAGEDAGKAAGRSFGPAMQAQVADVGLRIGEQIGQQIASRLTAALRDAIRDGVTQGSRTAAPAATKGGDEAGGAFARAMKARLEAAFKALPKANIGADTSEADADLQALRVRMETLAGKTIGVDINTDDAQAEIAAIQAELDRLGSRHSDPTVRADTAAALAQLQVVQTEIDRISNSRATVRVDTDGSFGQRLRAQVAAAQAALPDITVGADTSAAAADVQALRVQLETLSTKRVGIDIDSAAALAQIKDIQAQLAVLSASDADIAIRVDAARAEAELAQVQAMASALDGKTINVNVSTAQATAALLQLTIALGAVAAIPAIPVLAAGIGSIAAASVAAGVGVGALAAVAIPAFKGIAGALQAQKAAQDAASTASAKGAQANSQGASQALQMAGAQQALASAQRNAARQIEQSEEGVQDAVRSSAEANQTAAQQVTQSKKALAQAVQTAAQQQEQSEAQVEQAEESLATAQKTAKQAQLDLTKARADAAQQLKDLANQVVDAQLSERDAALSVQEAQQNLRATQAAGSKATALERAQAQLQYDQAVQRLKEQQEQTASLTKQKATADKAGVEGSDLVQQAQQKIADADKAVSDQQATLVKARQDAARQQVASQQSISDAQEKVAEASRNVSKVQEDGARSVQRAQESLVAAQQSAADSISSAQRQIQSASMSAAGGVDEAATAQTKYQQALAKLSPSTRATFDAFVRLKGAFNAWSTSLQPKVMPIFTRALDGLAKALPSLTPFVNGAAKAITTLQNKVSQGFKSPWWQSFKKDLAASVVPAIVGLGTSFGHVFVGMAGIIQAFLPHMDTISKTMQRITGRFADWGKNLKGSPAFEKFLDYAAANGPGIAKTIGDISSAFFQVSKSLSPLSGPILQIIGALARGIASIATTLPWLVQGIYLVIVAQRLWTLAVFAFNLVMEANPIVLIITAIVALVAAVIYAYKNWGWFRTAVQVTWAAIQTAALWAWNNVLKPIFDAFKVALLAVGTAASWLWTNVLSPVFSFIAAAARILMTVIVIAVVAPIVLAFKALAAIGQWLWANVLGPIFGWIGAKAQWLWTNAIKPSFALFEAGLRAVGKVASWLWTNAISPTFGWIAGRAKWVWTNGIKPAFDQIKKGFSLVGDAAKAVWSKVLQPTFGWIADKGKWLWDKGLKPSFDQIKKGIKAVGQSFDDARGFISKAWSKVEDIAKKPVRFIIDHIYNGGIVPTWNLVAKAFGAPQISKMVTKGWATGGVLPGYTPGKDVHQFYSPTGGGLELSGGEAIMRPEWTRAVGPGFVNSMNRVAATQGTGGVRAAMGGGQAFKDGGIFSWIGKNAKGLGSKAWDGVKKAAGWLKDGIESSARAGVKHVVDPLLAKLPGASSGFGKLIKRMPDHMLDSIFGYAKKADDKGAATAVGGKIPSGQHAAIITQALAAAHVPPPGTMAQWLAGMNTLITRESGWNASAINLWDSNAKAGHPSQGLTQTIPGTFNAYVPKSLKGRGILDAVANAAASIRYIVANYGNITKVQQANASLPPKGYDSGGYLQPGLNLAYNGTGKPEPVLTRGQMSALASSKTAAGPASFQGDLYLDSGEFLGRVRGEANQVVSQRLGRMSQRMRANGGGR